MTYLHVYILVSINCFFMIDCFSEHIPKRDQVPGASDPKVLSHSYLRTQMVSLPPSVHISAQLCKIPQVLLEPYKFLGFFVFLFFFMDRHCWLFFLAVEKCLCVVASGGYMTYNGVTLWSDSCWMKCTLFLWTAGWYSRLQVTGFHVSATMHPTYSTSGCWCSRQKYLTPPRLWS